MSYDSSIGLCPTNKKMNINIFALASILYQNFSFLAVMIFAIAYGLFEIGVC